MYYLSFYNNLFFLLKIIGLIYLTIFNYTNIKLRPVLNGVTLCGALFSIFSRPIFLPFFWLTL